MSNDCPIYERGFKCVVIVESYIEDFDVYGALEDPFEFEAPFIVPMPFSAPE